MADDGTIANSKLLDYYQSIISRMASNSSSLKGWAVSVATAVTGFAVKDGPPKLADLALVPLVLFFALDAYYLAAERVYRVKYNEAAEAVTTLPLEISGGLVTRAGWFSAAIQPVTWGVYFVLAVVAIVVGAGWFSFGQVAHK
jgi:hypothetical protein